MLGFITGFITFSALQITLSAAPQQCDTSQRFVSKEGILGDTGVFPWLGIIRVRIHRSGSQGVGVTGAVLVKEGYAIANAGDIAKIPKRLFRQRSEAMFIPRNGVPWYCGLWDYKTHPGGSISFKSVALVKLDPGEDDIFPIPICWPPKAYTPNILYALGYTDDNNVLGKTFQKLEPVSLKKCKEFYDKEGGVAFAHYRCGSGARTRETCIWENGMALASNATGFWVLLGLSIRGPGCATPARFIDLLPIFSWIESTTTLMTKAEQGNDQGFRKSAFKEGIEDIPAHNLLRTAFDEETVYNFSRGRPYEFDTEQHLNPYYAVDRIDAGAIAIQRITGGKIGDCDLEKNAVIYHDDTKLVTTQNYLKNLVYKISLYDFHYLNYTCVTLRVEAEPNQIAYLFYKTSIDQMEGAAMEPFGDTPEDILKHYIIHPVVTAKPTETGGGPADWKQGPQLRPKHIKDERLIIHEQNINVYLKFYFKKVGRFIMKVYGPSIPIIHVKTTKTPRRNKTTTSKRSLRRKKKKEWELVV